MPKSKIVSIQQDMDDFIVTIEKRVAVPRIAVMDSSDPALAIVGAVEANLSTALRSGAAKREINEALNILTGDLPGQIARDIAFQSKAMPPLNPDKDDE